MKWIVHGERSLYTSDWMNLTLVDIELPGGPRFEHHVLRLPAQAAGTVVVADDGVLLLWRHRFATDTWGWEIPAGRVDEGESVIDAARRETEEETGWRPRALRPIATYHPLNGSSDATFHLFVADGADHIGEPTDPYESERVEWLSGERLEHEVADGNVRDGMSLTGLLWVLAFGARRPGNADEINGATHGDAGQRG
jgi:8-oxo-dGTP pyrophosphatase MutT (NUDIX family)